jgi:NADPH:quinone reductase-like Zn-dependent oxidoreductase
MLKSLGADKVIDYTKEDFSQSGERYDVVFEAVDKSSFTACMRVLKEDGLYINVTTPIPNLEMMWTRLTTKKRLMLGENFEITAEDLIFLGELVEDGRLKPVIDRRYPLEQIVEAHRYVDTGRKRGNVVIIVDEARQKNNSKRKMQGAMAVADPLLI